MATKLIFLSLTLVFFPFFLKSVVEQTSSLSLSRHFVMDLVASSHHYLLLLGDELFSH